MQYVNSGVLLFYFMMMPETSKSRQQFKHSEAPESLWTNKFVNFFLIGKKREKNQR